MWNKLFVIIFIFIVNPCNGYEYDFLKGFNLTKPVIEREGSFYRLQTFLAEDMKISDIIETEILNEFTLESVFRFNTESVLFHLLTIGDKYSGNYITFSLKNTEESPSIRVTVKENNLTKITYITDSKRLIDGRWHKVVISFSKGKINAWLDCEYMENQFNSNKILSSLSFESKSIQRVVVASEDINEYVDFDIQKLKLYSGPHELIEIYCHDIPGKNLISRYNPKEINFLKMFHLGNTLSSMDGNFHRFYGPIERHIKLPEVFVSENVNNITFECLFRYNGTQTDDITLLEMRDIIHDQSIRFFIGSFESMGLAENDYKTHNDMLMRVALHNKKIFDGNWHKLVISYSKKFVKFWVDCHLVRTNISWFMSPVFFNGISHNITLLTNPNGSMYRDFDIMKLKLRTDFAENLNDICEDVPVQKISMF